MGAKKNIILGVTASIAIYKACELVRRLREENFSVTVVMTAEAEELIRPVVFQSLSGNKVYRKLFEQPQAWEIEHISLAEKTNLILVAPATANIIGKFACGVCDDFLTCIVCATKAPVVICPAMNAGMYTNIIVQENIKKLQGVGYKFVGPKTGKLACGTIGIGRLAGIDDIVRAVKKAL
jgi:phosphopantothenoylcysteine decarboxylase/phosphopantothenate--cysteine ligase